MRRCWAPLPAVVVALAGATQAHADSGAITEVGDVFAIVAWARPVTLMAPSAFDSGQLSLAWLASF